MNAFDRLCTLLSRLPGIGPKSAGRLAAYLLKADKGYCEGLGRAIASIQESIHPCSVCGSWTEGDPCPVCQDMTRDRTVICVVETAQDVRTIEDGASFKGLYHVLGGAISPLDGVGPGNLAFDALVRRVQDGSVKEVIIATNPTVSGDTTALYLQKILSGMGGLKITRLATGIPVGGDLEYADKLTLMRSFRARQEVQGT